MGKIYWLGIGVAALLSVVYALRAERFCMAPFREAQTAISVRYMVVGEGGMADYVTPVLGAPWRLPMEFGLFQSVIATFGATGAEDGAGRGVSVAFWLGCAALVFWLARELGLARREAAWTMAVFAVAPVHLAFGAAYLIESFALFFALLQVAAGVAWLRTRAWSYLGLCLLAGVIAAVSKGTTWVPAAFALGCIAGWRALQRARESRGDALRMMAPVALSLGVALIAGLIWVHYSDQVKLENPATAGLASSRLRAWNYGTLAQKLSPTLWAGMLAKESVLLFGPLFVLGVPLVWIVRRNLREVLAVVTILIGAFLVAPVVFTNLHYRHQYYVYANGVYAVLAAGLLVSRLPEGGWRRILWFGLPVSCVVTSMLFVWHHRALRFAVEDRIVHVLRQLPPESPVAIAGLDWSPYVPYYAGQRAWFAQLSAQHPEFARGLELNRPVGYRAVIWRGAEDDVLGRRLERELLPDAGAPQEIWPGIWLAVPKELSQLRAEMVASSDPAWAALEQVRTLVPNDRPGLLQYWEFTPANLLRSGASTLRVVLRRGPDLIYYDSKEGVLWRFSRS